MIKGFIRAIVRLVYNKRVLLLLEKIQNFLNYSLYSEEISVLGNGAIFGKDAQIRGGKYIEIGERFCAGKSLNLQAWDTYEGDVFQPRIVIGDDVLLTDFVQISCIDYVELGDRVLVGQNVYISDNSHGNADQTAIGVAPLKRKLTSKGGIHIGDDVWIGRGVVILSGVSIGNNAIIGANSVVVKDVPENCVVAGVPAKIIKQLNY